MLNLFCLDKDRVGDKAYRMLSSPPSALTSFVCHMLEFIIYCGLEELSTHLGVLLGVSVLFGLFDMYDSPTCKNMATLSSYL